MGLATHGYDEFRNVVGDRHDPAVAERAEQHADAVDRTLAEMGQAPTRIALLWLVFYVVIAFAAWAH